MQLMAPFLDPNPLKRYVTGYQAPGRATTSQVPGQWQGRLTAQAQVASYTASCGPYRFLSEGSPSETISP